jgi:hypothetical protein
MSRRYEEKRRFGRYRVLENGFVRILPAVSTDHNYYQSTYKHLAEIYHQDN